MSEGEIKKVKLEEERKPLVDLADFEFEKILNSSAELKSIFVLLQHKGNKEKAILIANKLPFDEVKCSEWLGSSQMKEITTNDIYGNYYSLMDQKFNDNKCMLIYPCTGKHIAKYSAQARHLIEETIKDYQEITLPYLGKSSNSIVWIQNCLDGKSEADRVIYDDKDPMNGFMLMMDCKWDGKDMTSMYCQVIIRQAGIKSLRDLNGGNLGMLKTIKSKVVEVMDKKYGIKKDEVIMYFHYQPSYYHLHVHVTHVNYTAPGNNIFSVLLNDVISNIELMSDYYQKATLTFIGKELDGLYIAYKEAGKA
uniref:M7GpppX diphosphatase n=1 Tax=Rhabditophanes sp. KR3021 TaxID=114890 RepID=A0AC35TQ00_9BILA